MSRLNFLDNRDGLYVTLTYTSAVLGGECTTPYAGIDKLPEGGYKVYDLFNASRNIFYERTFDTLEEAKLYVESVFALESP